MRVWMPLERPAGAAALVLTLTLGGCATNPATGQSQLSLISESQEIQMGEQAAEEVRQSMGLVADPELQAYVNRVGQQLAAGSERPTLPWTFQVGDEPTPNAFALPGGHVFITRGLVNLLTSEAELAGVLGHEIGHVTARHSVNQISKQQLANIGLGVGSVLVPDIQALSPVIGAGLNLLFLKYSREDEREADTLGFGYMRTQGFAVSEFGKVFDVLQRASPDDGAVPGWLSTHPTSAERLETARQRAAAVGPQPAATVGRDTYLRQLQDLPYGENPRNGFFRDNVFFHPDLRFRVTLPQGWKAQNLAQAVVASAPQGNAAFELTLVPGTPEQALQRFAQQQGVEVGRAVPSTGATGGVSAEFLAETQQGPLRGLVTYLPHNGRTYQLLGYAVRTQYDQFSSAFTGIAGSFQAVTDPGILNVKPPHIDIVRIDRRQTLQEFAGRYPSTINADELAIINQVPSASTALEAGTLVKRVVS